MAAVLPPEVADAAVELAPMWRDSFGNQTRIDYGTGHETTFAALLYAMSKLGVFSEGDRQALVLHVFHDYVLLMRKLQTTYWLEPAGSHGVWGLDDYQFLPFLWGAAQLKGHGLIKPKSIHNEDVLEAFGKVREDPAHGPGPCLSGPWMWTPPCAFCVDFSPCGVVPCRTICTSRLCSLSKW